MNEKVLESKFFLSLPSFFSLNDKSTEFRITKSISCSFEKTLESQKNIKIENTVLFSTLFYLFRINGYNPYLILFLELDSFTNDQKKFEDSFEVLEYVLDESFSRMNFLEYYNHMERKIFSKKLLRNASIHLHHLIVFYNDKKYFEELIGSMKEDVKILVIGIKKDGSEIIFFGNREIREEDNGTSKCIRKVFNHLQVFFQSINHQRSNLPVVKHDILTQQEYDFQFKYLVVNNFNETLMKKSLTTVGEEFEKSVVKYHDRIAIEISGQTITYENLNKKVNQVAHYLRDHVGIKKGDFVCQVIEKSINCSIFFFAICKIGCIFFAQDHTYSKERKKAIIQETNCKTIILNTKYSKYYQQFKESGIITNLIEIEKIQEDVLSFSEENILIEPRIEPTDLLYVLFSSGSTGEPKAVLGEHHHMFTYLFSNLHHLQTIEGVDMKNYMLFHKLVFVSVFLDMLLPILTGGIQRIIPQEIRYSPTDLINYITERKMKYIDIPPSVLRFFPRDRSLLPYLTHITFGGESMDDDTKKFWGDDCDVRIGNSFGMTETIGTHLHFLKKQQSPCHLGFTMINYYSYVLDEFQQPLPIGCPGELFIGCFGMEKKEEKKRKQESIFLMKPSRGYLNDLERDNNIYLKDPFNPQLNSMIIKTEDLVRLYLDGEMIYMGRKCFDIRINGIRIQLNKVEETIKNHNKVEDVVVIPINKKKNKLIAFIVLLQKEQEEEQEGEEEEQEEKYDISKELKEYLRKKEEIIEISIPKEFIVIKKFPLNFGGKISWKKLIRFYEEKEKKRKKEENKRKNEINNNKFHELDLKIRKIVSEISKKMNEQQKLLFQKKYNIIKDSDQDFDRNKKHKDEIKLKIRLLSREKSKFLKDIRSRKKKGNIFILDVEEELRKFKQICHEKIIF